MASKQAHIRARQVATGALPYLLLDTEMTRRQDPPIVVDAGGGLYCGYLADREDHWEFLQQRHLKSAKLTVSELHEHAVRNLVDRINEHMLIISLDHGLKALELDGEFEASLLLVPSLWGSTLAEFTTSTYLVAIPTRDTLLFTDAATAGALEHLREAVSKLEPTEEPPLTDTIFRLNSDGWAPVG